MGPQQMPDMDVYNMDIKPHFIYLLFDPQVEFEFYIFFKKSGRSSSFSIGLIIYIIVVSFIGLLHFRLEPRPKCSSPMISLYFGMTISGVGCPVYNRGECQCHHHGALKRSHLLDR